MSQNDTPGAEREGRLSEVLADWLEAAERGAPPEEAEYLRRYPELAGELAECFAAWNRFPRPGGPALRPVATLEPLLSESGLLGDFHIVREVGRGGMGIVYEAEQISLHRRVALKVLPFAGTLDPRQLQRFHNEAQAAAGLHHSNIVPVYSVGCECGVHFYAMQFIDGRTLAALIGELRKGAAAPAALSSVVAAGAVQATSPATPSAVNPQPSISYGAAHAPTRSLNSSTVQRAGYWRQVARLGEQAAEALQHAHDLGVIHRDVKPGNLLLDGRGNLWVADFGLAHVQSGASLTATGDLVGTLRYMSPEQALAQRVLIDHRTDVYSLGATLYELLTLRPPFDGSDSHELLRQIAFEEPAAPRRIDRAIPMELETIVLKALEKRPEDRYATAQELADDLRRYLTNEPIRARRSSLLQRARKVARRHPGVTVTTAVALLAGLLLGIAGLAINNYMVRQEQLHTKDALNRAEQQRAIAEAVRNFLRNKLLAQADPRAQADALRKAGRKTGQKPNPTIRDLLDRAAIELAQDKIEAQFPGQPLVQAEILKTVGAAYDGIGEYDLAIAHLERAQDLHVRELGPDHIDTLATLDSLARTYLDAGRSADAARLFGQVRDWRIAKLGPDHPETLASMNDLARCFYKLNRHAEALVLRKDLVRSRKAKLGPDHPDTLASMFNLANSYAALERFDQALALHQETLALRKTELGADDPDTLQSMNNLGNCYVGLGQWPEALKFYKEAVERRRSTLGDDHPDTLRSMYNVAVTYSFLGRHAEALKLHEEVLTLRMKKVRFDHPETLQSMNELAWMLATSPDPKLRDPRRALELAKKAVDLAPEKGDFRNTLGAAYYRAGDWECAVRELAKSTELRKGGDSTDWFLLAMAHWRLGNKSEGRACYDRAVQWMEKNKPQDQELHRFRVEAAALLDIEKK
jgi:serine/threonine protein kinase